MNHFRSLAVLIILIAALPSRAADADGFTPLFNGKDLAGWVPCNVATGTKGSDTFTVKDGMIYCTGIPTGVMRTEKMYENFIAELEWRHMVPKGNSGFFLWADDITSKGVPFSRGLEVQILDGPNHPQRVYTTHGDLFPIHGATAKPDNPGKTGSSRSYPTEDRSKPSPEWNHYRVEAINGKVTLSVNGKVVNSIQEVSPRKGYLCLESEGGVVQFRNLRIKELPPGEKMEPKHLAIADRGFKTLYNGVNLDGWETRGPGKQDWKAKDWTLRFEPPAPDAKELSVALWTAAEFAEGTLIFDVKSVKSVLLRLGESAISIPPAVEDAKKPARWRRVHVTFGSKGGSVWVDGEQLKDAAIEIKQPRSIGLNPTGQADFANLYISPRSLPISPAVAP